MGSKRTYYQHRPVLFEDGARREEDQGEGKMAFSEAERVALYWPKHAIRSLRREPVEQAVSAPNTSPSFVAAPLEGGCVLYRFPDRRH